MLENTKLLKFETCGDENGSLIALEQNKNIPFDIKRVYYIFDTKKRVVRGRHAHKNLEQVLICVKGSCKFLLDNGKSKEVIELNCPDTGLYIGKNIWREFYDFTPDCIIIVIASEFYDPDEYIKDYDEFLATVK